SPAPPRLRGGHRFFGSGQPCRVVKERCVDFTLIVTPKALQSSYFCLEICFVPDVVGGISLAAQKKTALRSYRVRRYNESSLLREVNGHDEEQGGHELPALGPRAGPHRPAGRAPGNQPDRRDRDGGSGRGAETSGGSRRGPEGCRRPDEKGAVS